LSAAQRSEAGSPEPGVRAPTLRPGQGGDEFQSGNRSIQSTKLVRFFAQRKEALAKFNSLPRAPPQEQQEINRT